MQISRRTLLASSSVALAGAATLPHGLLAALEASAPPPASMTEWDDVARLFRLDPDWLHFAGFFISSHPQPVREAIERLRDLLDANPYAAVEHGMFMQEQDNLELRVRDAAARYLGGRREDVALVGSTTAGLALVYQGLPLQAGEEVVTTIHDHFSHHSAVEFAVRRSAATTRRIRLFDDAATATLDGILARVREGIGPATRVLGITWVHSSTGIRLPVREIAAELQALNRQRPAARQVLLVVDGVHGLGAVDEDVAAMGCDFFCAGTHKWILGPRGTGLVWARPERWALLRPLTPSFSEEESYTAWIEDRPPRGPTTAARMTPGGFHAYEHHWGATAAFDMHARIGRARVAARIHELNGRIKEGLRAVPRIRLHTPVAAAMSAGICCFDVEGMAPGAVVDGLRQRKVIASTSPYAVTHARLSAGLMNSPDQVDRALAALREVVHGG